MGTIVFLGIWFLIICIIEGVVWIVKKIAE